MKSPITGKQMLLHKEERTIEFRKEAFTIVFHSFLCEESGEQFTSTELDELNMIQVYNQYRDKYHLPFPEEIQNIREKYELSAVKMAQILGFGINSYRNYENGEVPSNANGKLIQMSNDPMKFKYLIEISESLAELEKQKLLKKIEKLIEENNNKFIQNEWKHYLLNGNLSDEFSGYKKPDFQKLTEMIVFFTNQLKPWKTMMNKLLFYSDFLMFKKTCFSMSGLQYRAINWGPVPNNYESIFEFIVNNGDVDLHRKELKNELIGEQFIPISERKCNTNIFTELELSVLTEVLEKFKDKNTSEIVELSHKEKAWIENEKGKKIISYKYAFDLIS